MMPVKIHVLYQAVEPAAPGNGLAGAVRSLTPRGSRGPGVFSFGSTIDHIIATWGYVAVFGVLALEGFGLFFLPGETTLIAAAIYTGETGKLNIVLVLIAAFGGAALGDNFAFFVGQRFGFPLLRRYGHYVSLREKRLKFLQYLFLRHGRSIVFVGRFVALLRTWDAFLAGADFMRWQRFAPTNALAILIWVSIWGGGAWWLGQASLSLLKWVGSAAFVIICISLIVGGIYFHGHEDELEARADEALPGPLRSHRASDLRRTSGG